MKQLTISLSFAALVAACGGARPAPQTVANSGGTAPAVADELVVELDGQRWKLAAAGGTVEPDGEYRYRVVTAGYTLDIGGWPDSDAFVQTLEEHLVGYREKGAFEVVHQADNGRGNFEAIIKSGGKVDVTVLIRPEPGMDGAMCGASLADGSDWQAAADACRSLRRDDGMAEESYDHEGQSDEEYDD